MHYDYQGYAFDVQRDDDGGYVITSLDVPGVITQCDHADDIEATATDALLTMFQYMMADREPIPSASYIGDAGYRIHLSMNQATKIAAYNALLRRNETFLGLSKKMDKDPKEIRRAFSLRTTTKTAMLEKMLAILGGEQKILFAFPAE